MQALSARVNDMNSLEAGQKTYVSAMELGLPLLPHYLEGYCLHHHTLPLHPRCFRRRNAPALQGLCAGRGQHVAGNAYLVTR